MNLREAQAPLAPDEGRMRIEVGVLLRGEIRRAAVRHGLDYYEEKGWLDSTFIVRGPAGQMITFQRAFDAWRERLDRQEQDDG